MNLRPKTFVLAVVATTSLVCAPVHASDVPALASLLRPAFLAMNYGNVCAQVGDWSTEQPRGMHGTAAQYGQFVKMEVTSTLRADDEMAVLRAAADAARDEALAEFRKSVRDGDPAGQTLRFQAWCKTFVSAHIARYIIAHDGNHTQFQANVRKARSDDQ